MRLPLNLFIILAAIGVAVLVWYASGGRFFLFFLPLMLGLPLMGRLGRGGGRGGGRDHI